MSTPDPGPWTPLPQAGPAEGSPPAELPGDAGSPWSNLASVVAYVSAVLVTAAAAWGGTLAPGLAGVISIISAFYVGYRLGRGRAAALGGAMCGVPLGFLVVVPRFSAAWHKPTFDLESFTPGLSGGALASAIGDSLANQTCAATVGTLAPPAIFASIPLLFPARPAGPAVRPSRLLPFHLAACRSLEFVAVIAALFQLLDALLGVWQRFHLLSMAVPMILGFLFVEFAGLFLIWLWLWLGRRAPVGSPSLIVTALGGTLVLFGAFGPVTALSLCAAFQTLGATRPLMGLEPAVSASSELAPSLVRVAASWLALGPTIYGVLWFCRSLILGFRRA